MSRDKGSVIAVMEAVAQYGEIGRAELSKVTGFSQMTVGKAVELLDSSGIIIQRKQDGGSVGRKAGICSLDKSRGMLLFDLSGKQVGVRIVNISLEVESEYTSEFTELSEAFLDGFSKFVEIFGDGLLGIGCIVPKGKIGEFSPLIKDALGHVPELIVEYDTAYSIANADRFDVSGMALYLRLFADGKMSGAIVNGGVPYVGAHGNAGGFSNIIASRTELPRKISEISMVLDPEFIHIACEIDKEASELPELIEKEYVSLSGEGAAIPKITAEPLSLCRTAFDGAAAHLRERVVVSKMSNNS